MLGSTKKVEDKEEIILHVASAYMQVPERRCFTNEKSGILVKVDMG